mgnify:CR=1 FL=1
MHSSHYMNRRIVCKDGFSFSCQANEYAYCQPRETDADYYSEVEIGYPNREDSLIYPRFAEGYCPTEPVPATRTVYPYVPSDIVCVLIDKHGGILEGEVPKGVPSYGVTHCKKMNKNETQT